MTLPDRCDIKDVTGTEVHEILSCMANNKAGNYYGLRTKNYKLAGGLYYSFLAMCMNIMFIHGYIPANATQTVICPTVKDKNSDLSDIFNYCPTALATIFLKIFEHAMLNRIYEYLKTSDNQFLVLSVVTLH